MLLVAGDVLQRSQPLVRRPANKTKPTCPSYLFGSHRAIALPINLLPGRNHEKDNHLRMSNFFVASIFVAVGRFVNLQTGNTSHVFDFNPTRPYPNLNPLIHCVEGRTYYYDNSSLKREMTLMEDVTGPKILKGRALLTIACI